LASAAPRKAADAVIGKARIDAMAAIPASAIPASAAKPPTLR